MITDINVTPRVDIVFMITVPSFTAASFVVTAGGSFTGVSFTGPEADWVL